MGWMLSLKTLLSCLLLVVILFAIWAVERLRPDQKVNPEIVKQAKQTIRYQSNLKQHSDFMIMGLDTQQDQHQNLLARLRYTVSHLDANNYDHKLIIERAFQIERRLARQDIDERVVELRHLTQFDPHYLWSLTAAEQNKSKLLELIQHEQALLIRYDAYLKQKNEPLLYPAGSILDVSREKIIGYANTLRLLSFWFMDQPAEQKLQAVRNYYLALAQLLAGHKINTEETALIEAMHRSIELMHILNQQVEQPIQLAQLNEAQFSSADQAQYTLAMIYDLLMTTKDEESGRPLFFYEGETLNDIYAAIQLHQQRVAGPYNDYVKHAVLTLEKEREKEAPAFNSEGQRWVKMAQIMLKQDEIQRRVLDSKIRLFNHLMQGNTDIELLNQNTQAYEYYRTSSAYLPHTLCIRDPYSSDYQREAIYFTDACLLLKP